MLRKETKLERLSSESKLLDNWKTSKYENLYVIWNWLIHLICRQDEILTCPSKFHIYTWSLKFSPLTNNTSYRIGHLSCQVHIGLGIRRMRNAYWRVPVSFYGFLMNNFHSYSRFCRVKILSRAFRLSERSRESKLQKFCVVSTRGGHSGRPARYFSARIGLARYVSSLIGLRKLSPIPAHPWFQPGL